MGLLGQARRADRIGAGEERGLHGSLGQVGVGVVEGVGRVTCLEDLLQALLGVADHERCLFEQRLGGGAGGREALEHARAGPDPRHGEVARRDVVQDVDGALQRLQVDEGRLGAERAVQDQGLLQAAPERVERLELCPGLGQLLGGDPAEALGRGRGRGQQLAGDLDRARAAGRDVELAQGEDLAPELIGHAPRGAAQLFGFVLELGPAHEVDEHDQPDRQQNQSREHQQGDLPGSPGLFLGGGGGLRRLEARPGSRQALARALNRVERLERLLLLELGLTFHEQPAGRVEVGLGVALNSDGQRLDRLALQLALQTLERGLDLGLDLGVANAGLLDAGHHDPGLSHELTRALELIAGALGVEGHHVDSGRERAPRVLGQLAGSIHGEAFVLELDHAQLGGVELARDPSRLLRDLLREVLLGLGVAQAALPPLEFARLDAALEGAQEARDLAPEGLEAGARAADLGLEGPEAGHVGPDHALELTRGEREAVADLGGG